MSDKGWISLNDYSIKYRLSLSTLRRRIRSKEIEHYFDQGKYWLPDKPVAKHTRIRPKVNDVKLQKESETAKEASPKAEEIPISAGETVTEGQCHSLLSSANRLLQEIKGAYVQIMKEKEEQLLQLRKEVADLKTLVKILEAENQKLRGLESEDMTINS